MHATGQEPDGGRWEASYPNALRDAESRLVERRREHVWPKGQHPPFKTGVGLSGGGIRSATFCLGAFQALARNGLVGRIDFLSTVSGGGYFGGFLGRLFTRKWIGSIGDVEEALQGRAPREGPNQPRQAGEAAPATPRVIDYLRQHGRYLAPRGAGDALVMVAVVVRNWLAMQIALLVVLFVAAVLLQWLRLGLDVAFARFDWVRSWASPWPGRPDWLSRATPLWWLAPLIVVAWALPAGWAYWLLRGPFRRSERTRPASWELPLAVALWLVPVVAAAAAVWWFGLRGPDAARWSLIVWSALGALAVSVWRLVPLYRGTPPLAISPLVGLLATVAALATGAWWALAADKGAVAVCLAAATVVPLLALALCRVAERRGRKQPSDQNEHNHNAGTPKSDDPKEEADPSLHADALARRRLSTWLDHGLAAALIVVVVAAIETVGELVASGRLTEALAPALASFVAAIGALAVPAGKIFPLLLRGRKRPSLPVSFVAGAAALVVLFLVLTLVDASAHLVRWWDAARPWAFTLALAPEQAMRLGIATSLALLLALLVGATWPFLNGSGQAPFYQARLARAYLGASNPARYDGGDMPQVDRPQPDDDVSMVEYYGLQPPKETDAASKKTDAASKETDAGQGAVAAKGAPLHLINATINDTRSGGTQGQDRKGVTLAVGPCGFSAGVEHHAVFQRPGAKAADQAAGASEGPNERGVPAEPKDPTGALRKAAMRVPLVRVAPAADTTVFGRAVVDGKGVFLGEGLTLGQWLAISGAAFTTGTGYRTSFGLSFLAGFVNARLGYWWLSGRDYARSPRWPVRVVRRLFAVQAFLVDEFLAWFPGTSRPHWYLSDGGHFENLGGYELLRRRLDFIVLIDAEADEEYRLGGLEALVRKARIDFGAEFHFLDASELVLVLPEARRFGLGTLDDVAAAGGPPGAAASGGPPTSRAHAALGVVGYPGGTDWSLLLYVKATVTGDEDLDVRQYHATHAAFPHESTSDQFFDEAQWESYRRLGEHVGAGVFGRGGPFEQWSVRRPEAALATALRRVGVRRG